MKKLVLLAIAALFSLSAYSQILKPVTWSYAAKRTANDEATVFLKAAIDPGWHIYSQYMEDGGPVRTSFSFSPSRAFSLAGKTAEPRPVTQYEDTFDMQVSYFENSVIFSQKIKLNTGEATVKGKVEFMVCNDKQCLPPEEIEFSIPVK